MLFRGTSVTPNVSCTKISMKSIYSPRKQQLYSIRRHSFSLEVKEKIQGLAKKLHLHIKLPEAFKVLGLEILNKLYPFLC